MSSNEATKNPPGPQPYPPTYPPFSGAYPPPGAYPSPYYTYAPPPDGAHGENGGQAGHPQYMMAYPPPGMVYAYPPPGQGFYQGEANGKQSKRKQVKMACTNCAAACKRCDEARPCERCIKYGQADQCRDGVRKERKKGIKRGPYKRKNKSGGSNDGTTFASFPQQPGNGDAAASSDWQPTPQPGTAAQGTTSNPGGPPTVHTVPQFGPGPPPTGAEGYYPYYYPPPHGFMPPPPQQGQEGHAESSQAQSGPNAVVQYFSVHPGGYAPFPHYSPYPPQPGGPPQLQQTMDPKKANVAHRQESEEEAEEEEESSPVPPTLVPVHVPASVPALTPSKKRTRTAKTTGNEPRAKKVKTSKKVSKTKATAKVAGANGHESADDKGHVVSTAG